MPFDIAEIKQVRKQLNLTQSQLAKAAGVSQSLITKVESGSLDPTFSKAKQIFQALEHFSGKKEVKASEIMNTSLISAAPEASIKEAVNIMKKHAISQMPVMKDGNVVGFISEAIILDAILERKGSIVRDIMKDVPPILSKNTSINVISGLLKFYQMVVVAENGKAKGVITRTDVLKRI